MEAVCKSTLTKNASKINLKKRSKRIFKFIQKTKKTFLVLCLTLILVGAPIGIEYILKSSYMVSYFTIVVIYPFLYVVYKMR
jgi:hypothetical protein